MSGLVLLLWRLPPSNLFTHNIDRQRSIRGCSSKLKGARRLDHEALDELELSFTTILYGRR